MRRRPSHLRLVGRPERSRVKVAPRRLQPFPVDALVLEEDTWFALSAAPEVGAPSVHPLRTLTEAWEAEPAEPGTVHVRPGFPLRFLAVVHDLSLEPTWQVRWIEAALRASLVEAQRRGLASLGIEPLGAVHGRFSLESFDSLLAELLSTDVEWPKAVWRIELET